MRKDEKAAIDAFAILREKEVMAKFGISRATLRRWIAKGDFPAPLPLGARSKGWLQEDIDRYLATLKEKRSA